MIYNIYLPNVCLTHTKSCYVIYKLLKKSKNVTMWSRHPYTLCQNFVVSTYNLFYCSGTKIYDRFEENRPLKTSCGDLKNLRSTPINADGAT